MQFSTALLALFAATTLALPTTVSERNFFSDAVDKVEDVGSDVVDAGKSAVGAVEDAVQDVPGDLQQAFGANCQLGKCAAALGPTAVGCGVAAAQGFADPLADIPCLAAALNSVANVPASCAECHVPDIPGLGDLLKERELADL